jgi:phosphatidate cytidylyltransferase
MVPFGIYVVWSGGIILQIATGFIGVLACYEWANLITRDAAKWQKPAVMAVLAAGVVSTVQIALMGFLPVIVVSLMAGVLALVVGLVLRRHPLSFAFGAIYLAFPFGAFIALREGTGPMVLAMLSIMIIVWGTDTAAYIAGKAFGGPSISALSPNKTWTGSIAGAIFAVLVGVSASGLTQTSLIAWVTFSLVVCVVSQLGDLMESMFKRRFGVKDMSKLIPGHGGVLDRLDGLIAAVSVSTISLALYPDLIRVLFGESA